MAARRRAVTLVETLVVVGVMAVVGGLLVGVGSGVWKIVQSWR